MKSKPKVLFAVTAACVVAYLLVLPALPDSDGAAENIQWALSVVVLVAAVTSFVLGIRAVRHRT